MSKEVKFIIRNISTRIEGAVLPEVLIACGVKHKFYIMKRAVTNTGRYRTYPQEMETIIQLFNTTENSFPTGWFTLIKNIYIEQGYKIYVSDSRTGEINKYDFNTVMMELPHELRPYQQEAVDTLLKKTRTIIKIGTGGGKTLIAMAATKALQTDTLIIVPSLNLLDQTHMEFSDAFDGAPYVGNIGEGNFNPKAITVATSQTLWARRDKPEMIDFLKSINFVIFDECHFVGGKAKKKKGERLKTWELGNSWYILGQMMVNAKYRLGLSATPGGEKTLRRRLLEATIGRIGYEKGASELIEEGFLTPVRVKMITVKIPEKKVISSFRPAYEQNIIGSDLRNNVIVEEAKKLINAGKTVLITVKRIEAHGQVLMDLFEGYDVEFLHGKTKGRKEIIQKFKDGKLRCLVTTVIREGTNIPVADVLIFAQAGNTDTVVIQRIGRVMRLAEGKEEALIIDIYDEDGKMGRNEWKPGILEKHSMTRLDVYRSEGAFKVEVK